LLLGFASIDNIIVLVALRTGCKRNNRPERGTVTEGGLFRKRSVNAISAPVQRAPPKSQVDRFQAGTIVGIVMGSAAALLALIGISMTCFYKHQVGGFGRQHVDNNSHDEWGDLPAIDWKSNNIVRRPEPLFVFPTHPAYLENMPHSKGSYNNFSRPSVTRERQHDNTATVTFTPKPVAHTRKLKEFVSNLFNEQISPADSLLSPRGIWD
jgi:hypothetical protein